MIKLLLMCTYDKNLAYVINLCVSIKNSITFMSDSSFPRIATWIYSESQSIRKAFTISEFSGSALKAMDVNWSE